MALRSLGKGLLSAALRGPSQSSANVTSAMALTQLVNQQSPLQQLQQWRTMRSQVHPESLEYEDEDTNEHHAPGHGTPTVFDKLIQFTVIDLAGRPHTVRGLRGKPLSLALIEYGFPTTYFFPNYGYYTQQITDCHVFIPKELWAHIPNIRQGGAEADAIKRMFREFVQDYQKETSYFASYIVLTNEFKGCTIGIGPVRPWILHDERQFDGKHNNFPEFKRPPAPIF